MKALFVLGSIASLGVCAGAAMAGGSYTGNYPVTVTRSNHSDGTYCLKLIDDGGTGRRHSGSAVLPGGPQVGLLPYGSFQVISGIIVASGEQQLADGDTAGLIFTGQAANGNIETLVYDQDYGGQSNDSGAVKIGEKNGC